MILLIMYVHIFNLCCTELGFHVASGVAAQGHTDTQETQERAIQKMLCCCFTCHFKMSFVAHCCKLLLLVYCFGRKIAVYFRLASIEITWKWEIMLPFLVNNIETELQNVLCLQLPCDFQSIPMLLLCCKVSLNQHSLEILQF